MDRSFTVIAVIAVLCSLLLLLYASSAVRVGAKYSLFEELRTKKADVTIYKLKAPEQICFALDSAGLDRYPFLGSFIQEADSMADTPIQDLADRYDAFGGSANTTDVVRLVSDFGSKFNHTSSVVTIRGQYKDDQHTYRCNFEYAGNEYGLWLELKSISFVNDYSGYVTMAITDRGIEARIVDAVPQGRPGTVSRVIVDPSDLTMYLSFNNTVLWTNELHDQQVWAGLRLTETGNTGQSTLVSTQIPPDNSWDYRLQDLSSNAATFHYEVTLPDGAKKEGSFHVNRYPICMSQPETSSLYGQNGFDVRYPAHLPEGYRFICATENTGFSVIQSYWNLSSSEIVSFLNRTGSDDLSSFTTRIIGSQNGMIQIWSFKSELPGDWPSTTSAADKLKSLPASQQSDARIVRVGAGGNVSAVSYAMPEPNQNVNVVEIYNPADGEAYIIRSSLPMEELIAVAGSMYAGHDATDSQ